MNKRHHQSAEGEYAVKAGKLWAIEVDSIRLIGHSGNSVYCVQRDNKLAILRLTDPNYRTLCEMEAELGFIEHVAKCGVKVSRPLPSANGLLIEQIAIENDDFMASMFEYAPGIDVDCSSPYWSDSFVREWGRSLGMLHKVSRSAPAFERWHWSHEHLIRNALGYIPSDDKSSIDEFYRVMEWFGALLVSAETFGMTHSDYGPGNFHYSPTEGITAFDFGNCCYHWYIWDLAVGLRWMGNLPGGHNYRDALLEGYSEIYPIDSYLLENLEWFIRLRYLYIYLDRLMDFIAVPNDEAKKEVHKWRLAVHEGIRARG